MSMIRPPRTERETTVAVPTSELFDQFVRRQIADTIIRGMVMRSCPTDPTGHLCHWCEKEVKNDDGIYTGHRQQSHAEQCPWRLLLHYFYADFM